MGPDSGVYFVMVCTNFSRDDESPAGPAVSRARAMGGAVGARKGVTCRRSPRFTVKTVGGGEGRSCE